MYEKQKQSPYRSQQFHNLENSKQNVVKQLQIVFTYYAGKGSKYNYQELPQKYFMQIASELYKILHKNNQLNRKSQKWMAISTLYYTKGRTKPLYFTQFLQLLPGLARLFFTNDNLNLSRSRFQSQQQQKTCTKKLLSLFEKLYKNIVSDQLYRKGIKCQQITQQTRQFLFKLKDSLLRLYKVYFEYQMNLKDKSKDYQNKSFEGLLQLMKDFQVYPKLISASQLYFIYSQILNSNNYHLSLLSPSLYTKIVYPRCGQHFTLTCFAQSLILTSHISIGKLKRIEGQQIYFSTLNISQKDALKLLLEYMQTMKTVKQKYCKFTTQRFSLIVYEEYADYISKKEQNLINSPSRIRSISGQKTKQSFMNILNKLDI